MAGVLFWQAGHMKRMRFSSIGLPFLAMGLSLATAVLLLGGREGVARRAASP